MLNKQIPYHNREYDSRVVTNDVVKRAYFDTDKTAHQAQSTQIITQLNEMLPWICENMVLPTVESSAIREWALSQELTQLTDKGHVKLPAMPTRTRIPVKWVDNITDSRNIWRNQRTGDVRHTKPCPLGVLGGLVANFKTQRELTDPQIKALNILFASTNDPIYDYLFPSHWYRFEFVQTPPQRVDDNLSAIFGL